MRCYITQYRFWWSANAAGWRALIEHALANDGNYDLDKIPGIKALRSRPATVRVDSNTSTGRDYYIDVNGHQVHRPLDWTLRDWEVALDEVSGGSSREPGA